MMNEESMQGESNLIATIRKKLPTQGHQHTFATTLDLSKFYHEFYSQR
jgi:hypothetical protein